MIAFKNFKEIQQLETVQDKHRAWLKDYEGLFYSIAVEEKHQIKWASDKQYYYDRIWSPSINCMAGKKNRLCIEFDGDKKVAKESLEIVYNKLKEMKIGFIRSTHKGKTDYIWIEFDRDLTQKEKQAFLIWIAPEGSEVDLNFSSARKVFPILFAVHWKHSLQRELPVEYNEGEIIRYNELDIPIEQKIIKKVIKNKGFEYVTGIKDAAQVFTLEGQAERFNEIQPLFYDKSGMFWLWNSEDTFWERVDEVDILNMISKSTGKDVISSKNRTEILNALKQKGRLNMPLPIKPTWIQFKDKIYDIQNGNIFKTTPNYFVTNPIPYKLHPENFENTPNLDRIFEQWVGKKHVKTLYEIIAYCLLPDYPLHRIFCFIGAGLNGKSCFLNFLRKFIGNNNVCSTELDTLLNSRFEVTRLHKKLVCQMGETNFNEMSKTSVLKKLSGGDLIGFEYKNKNPFEEQNYAKIIISTNNLPSTTDKTIGFYRRWLIIDFPNTFSEQKDILKEIPEEEYESLALKCMKLLKDLLDKREFYNEGSIKDRQKRYEDRSDPLEKFFNEYIIEDYDSYIWKSEFEKKLNEWCKEYRFREMSSVAIGRKMKEKGIEQQQKYEAWMNDYGKKGGRAWVGITWKQTR